MTVIAHAEAQGSARPETPFVDEVCQSMADRPRALPPGAALDAAGHALFARVTALPDFHAARAETELLRLNRDAILGAAGGPPDLVELQAGTATAVRPLLDRAARYVAVERCDPVREDAVGGLRAAFPRLDVRGFAGDGLAFLAARPAEEPRLVLLLGSALGRLDAAGARLALWRLRDAMAPGDRLLVGMDLDKEPSRLRAAHDDAGGVCAAFARNALRRVNREVGTDFDASDWVYATEVQAGRVEARFEARRPLRVRGGRAGEGWTFEAGEPLVVEHAHKPSPAQVAALALGAGLRVGGSWCDEARGYGLFLLKH